MPDHERIASILREMGAMLGELADEIAPPDEAPPDESPLGRLLRDLAIGFRALSTGEPGGGRVPPSREALAEAFGAEHVQKGEPA